MCQISLMEWQCNFSAGTDEGMPRLRWKDGVTILTDLTGSQIVGVMFSIVILSLTQDGCNHLGPIMFPNKKKSSVAIAFCICSICFKCNYVSGNGLRRASIGFVVIQKQGKAPVMPSMYRSSRSTNFGHV